MQKNEIDDVIKDSSQCENLKYFLGQIVGPIEKVFSHKKFVATRPPKLDPMLVCFSDFFWVKNYQT